MANRKNTRSHENCNGASNSRGLCTIEGCTKPIASRGWCGMHRARWRRYGDPLFTKTAPEGEGLKLLLSLVGHNGDECILWPYSKSRDGYGQTYYCGEVMGAHRAMCIIEHGPPPTDKHHAAHWCGKGREGCISPDHLRWATPKENIHDKNTHGSMARGEGVGSAKLREHEVVEIIKLNGVVPATHLAKKYDVDPMTIRAIQTGKTWAHIPR